ncbi:MAG: hypothetical protein J5724_06255 [Ruminococcus sp.]|nr:hypothetical protein [Ruminococcus sp.]
MQNKWNKAAADMKRLADSYTAKKKLPQTEIHQEIFMRTLKLLGEHCPEAEKLIRPNTEIMLPYTIRADEKGDRENGAGRHYYCGCTSNGIPRKPVGGYLLNGKDLFAKSARTMFEEDYTMALTMHCGGFIKQGAIYLARAVHLMSDMCCLPHATKMTYFSSKRNVHISYEELARAMYPEFVPEQHLRTEQLRRFSARNSFSVALNRSADAICQEIPRIFTSPEKEITYRLYDTEAAVAALLYRFYRDTIVSPLQGHYIANGMTCRPFADMPALTIRITERGISFELKGALVNTRFGKTFRAAHRINGLFSISPLGNDKGLVLTRSSRGLTSFDPRDERQLISIK